MLIMRSENEETPTVAAELVCEASLAATLKLLNLWAV